MFFVKRDAATPLNGTVPKQAKSCSPDSFARHFSELFGKASEDNFLNLQDKAHLIPPRAETRNDIAGPPSRDEIRVALGQLRNGKAAGISGIPPEAFKAGGEPIVNPLYKD